MPFNHRRLLVAGLSAGLVICLSALSMVPVVGTQMDEALQSHGAPPLGPGAIAFFLGVSLVLGVTLVWIYAAIQPRFGPGARTAVIAAVVLWVPGTALPNASLVVYGFLPAWLSAVGTLWGLMELLVAGQVGARLYRDE